MLAVLLLAVSTAVPPPGHWATVNNHRIYYETIGTGRPLVLLHGGGNTIHGSFDKQIAEFAKTHTIIAPEQIGHGHSPDVDGPLTYAAMADDTAALLEQLKVRDADVVGWSDGGNIALILAVRHPDLVRRVVVSGANFSPEGLPAEDRAHMLDEEEHPPASAKPFDRKITHMWRTSPTPEELSPTLLGRIQKPVMVMAGDHDAILLDHTIALYRAIPNARLCILPGTSHGTFIQRAEWVNSIVISFFAEK
ncbi:MAG: alpha/beta fold hydrolase [Thermoanaerobaculia bacterium]